MSLKKYVIRPFETIQEKTLLVIGILFILISSPFAFLTNSRFDGVIDMHTGSNVLWYQPLIDNIVNTICLTVLLYLLSLLLPTKARIIDILNVALISRIPLYFTLFTNIGGINQETGEYLLANISDPTALANLPILNLIILGLGAILSLIALVLMGVLIYQGYKTATNSKKLSHNILLVPAVLIAEVISKYLTYQY